MIQYIIYSYQEATLEIWDDGWMTYKIFRNYGDHGFNYEHMKKECLIFFSKIADYAFSWVLNLFNQILLTKTE